MDYEEMLRRLMSGQYAQEAVVPQPLPDDYGSTIGIRAMQDLLKQTRANTKVVPRDSLGQTAQERLDLARAKMGAQYGGAPGLGFGANVADRYAAAHAPINVPGQQNVDAQWALGSRRYPTMPGDSGPAAPSQGGPRSLANIRERAQQLLAGNKYVKTLTGGVRRVEDVGDELNGVAKQQASLGPRFGGFATPEERRADAQQKRAIAQAQRELNAKNPAVALNAAARLRRAGLLGEGDTMSVMQDRIQQFVRAGLSPQMATEMVASHMQQASQDKYRQDSLALEREKLTTAKETAAEERRQRNLDAAEERKLAREKLAETSALERAMQQERAASAERVARIGVEAKDPLDTPSGRSAFAIKSGMNPNDPKTQSFVKTGTLASDQSSGQFVPPTDYNNPSSIIEGILSSNDPPHVKAKKLAASGLPRSVLTQEFGKTGPGIFGSVRDTIREHPWMGLFGSRESYEAQMDPATRFGDADRRDRRTALQRALEMMGQ